MNSKVICSIKEDVNINDILPNLPASNQQQIGIKRLYDLSDKMKEFMNERNAVNSLTGFSDEELLTQILKEMPNYEKRLYNTFELDLPNGIDVEELIKYLNDHDMVHYAELDEINYKEEVVMDGEIPNDPLFNDLYGLQKLECLTAWKKTEGENVIVAVVDSGVDYNHPDIQSNMWTNANGEFGYNFVNNTPDPMDDDGHGTHVAGTIAATGNNSIGIVGVAPKAKIMAVKGLSPSGGSSLNLSRCIKYAVDNGAHIINNSWGPGRSQSVRDAIEYADRKGVITLFAAGNANMKVTPDMAAGNTRVISVAAVNRRDSRASFSNFGTKVDVSAPGVSIKSLQHGGNMYSVKSGTSMACPHVAGLAALIKSMEPDIKRTALMKLLQQTVDPHYSDQNKPIGEGRVNARKSVKQIAVPTQAEAMVTSYDAVINESAQIYLINLYFKQKELKEELKFNSIGELSACLDIMETKKMAYSFDDQTVRFF
ncbi:S8 family peptidase [Aureisphaera galaxeae]|uniref:S8 family peptidase n=1 Tax=Aureisphaera galaxeae TaxID=1538023 RepID=UPI00234FF483|nr:S8 family peptidase [Aureisphaera galaxeae]MDC8004285.1 S8 family peptidase [Aureisphaera galaxeae]